MSENLADLFHHQISLKDVAIIRFGQTCCMSLIVALMAFLIAAARINHGLMDSSLSPGPGLTLDESFNIQQGVYLTSAIVQHGPLILAPDTAREVFGGKGYLPDHPPLGRLFLGIAHESTDWCIRGAELSSLNIPAARLGACAAMAIIVFLIAEFARRRYDMMTSLICSGSLIIMPQFTGHARLATLETATSLAWFAALLPLLAWWTGPNLPTRRQAIISGLLWGILMLTKMQGILLPPLLLGWALWNYRQKAIGVVLLWSISGGLLFFAWPWLWLDPINNTLSYLGRAADRQTLYVWYFGQRFRDVDVPWHFPFVTTAITVPLVVLIGLIWRLLLRQLDRTEQLLLASLIWPLIVFAIPGTPVYDGARLFLCIMPVFAILSGRGSSLVLQKLLAARRQPDSASASRWIPIAALLTMVAAARAITAAAFMSPFAISEYSDLVGGSRGAERLGMEASYWSEALNGEFWKHVPENSEVMVAPVSHQFQLSAIEELVPIVRARGIHLVPFEYDPLQQRGLLLLLHRKADLRQSLRTVPAGAEILVEVRGDGVVLARLIDSTNAKWTATP